MFAIDEIRAFRISASDVSLSRLLFSSSIFSTAHIRCDSLPSSVRSETMNLPLHHFPLEFKNSIVAVPVSATFFSILEYSINLRTSFLDISSVSFVIASRSTCWACMTSSPTAFSTVVSAILIVVNESLMISRS